MGAVVIVSGSLSRSGLWFWWQAFIVVVDSTELEKGRLAEKGDVWLERESIAKDYAEVPGGCGRGNRVITNGDERL